MTITREQWLNKAVAKLTKEVFPKDVNVPENIRVSVGFPSRRATSNKNRRVGECWQPAASADKHYEIFITPMEGKAIEVLDTLAHEMIHACCPAGTGHKGPFKRLATQIGLEGKMTATVAGAELTKRLNAVLADLGEYPHAALDPRKSGRPVQGTRLLKIECWDCGYICRTTTKWIEDVGYPTWVIRRVLAAVNSKTANKGGRMRTIVAVIVLVTMAGSVSAAELVQGTPKRRFTVVSPVSSDAFKVEKAYKALGRKADKMGADGVIQVQCSAGDRSHGSTSIFTSRGTAFAPGWRYTKAVCQGTAVRWN